MSDWIMQNRTEELRTGVHDSRVDILNSLRVPGTGPTRSGRKSPVITGGQGPT